MSRSNSWPELQKKENFREQWWCRVNKSKRTMAMSNCRTHQSETRTEKEKGECIVDTDETHITSSTPTQDRRYYLYSTTPGLQQHCSGSNIRRSGAPTTTRKTKRSRTSSVWAGWRHEWSGPPTKQKLYLYAYKCKKQFVPKRFFSCGCEHSDSAHIDTDDDAVITGSVSIYHHTSTTTISTSKTPKQQLNYYLRTIDIGIHN